MSERSKFLEEVIAYATRDPEAGPEIVAACSYGIGKALHDANQRASDMEAALVTMTVNRKSKWARETLQQVLRKWNGRLSFQWESFLKEKP